MAYIAGIDPNTPAFNDPAGQGDDQIRALKGDLKTSFPNVAGEVSASHLELSYVLDASAATLFIQAAAPTGWTKSVAHNNKALRIVSGSGGGSGGSVAFTTAFGSARATTSAGNHSHGGSTAAHALTEAQLPAHTHAYAPQGQFINVNLGVSGNIWDGTGFSVTGSTGGNAGHSHGISADGTHSHTTNLAVTYVDALICSKDAY